MKVVKIETVYPALKILKSNWRCRQARHLAGPVRRPRARRRKRAGALGL